MRHQVDHITAKKVQLFEKHRNDPANPRLFVILMRYRQFRMISDRKEITEFIVFLKYQYSI